MNNNEQHSNLIRKVTIVGFWLVVFAICFYVPNLVQTFIAHVMDTDQKVLNIYAFTEAIPRQHVDEFEKRTGIQVRINYFQNNEEVFAKLLITKGAGYDLIVCSDYMVDLFVKNNLLHEMDHTKISNYRNIDKRLLGHYFDPENRYAIPSTWTFYGLAISKAYFKNGYPAASWTSAFTKPPYFITMPDDARDATFLAGLYLFGQSMSFSSDELAHIKQLLIKQKAWIDGYATDKTEYDLTSGNVPLVVAFASYLKRMMAYNDDFDFLLPREGSMLIIEHFGIPIQAQNINAAYAFIDFLLEPEISAATSAHYGYNPVNVKSYQFIDPKFLKNPNFFPSDETMKKMQILSNKIPQQALEDIWLAVKIA